MPSKAAGVPWPRGNQIIKISCELDDATCSVGKQVVHWPVHSVFHASSIPSLGVGVVVGWARHNNRPLQIMPPRVHFLAILILLPQWCTSWSLLPGWGSTIRIQEVTDKCNRWDHANVSSLNISQIIEEGLPGEEVLKRKENELNMQKSVALKQAMSEMLKLKSAAFIRTHRYRLA
jgi:hypothetical protein